MLPPIQRVFFTNLCRRTTSISHILRIMPVQSEVIGIAKLSPILQRITFVSYGFRINILYQSNLIAPLNLNVMNYPTIAALRNQIAVDRSTFGG